MNDLDHMMLFFQADRSDRNSHVSTMMLPLGLMAPPGTAPGLLPIKTTYTEQC